LHDENTQGIRAVAWVEPLHQLWIANEDLHRILIVDSNGKYVGKVKTKNPVGMIFDKESGLVFVGSKKSSKNTGSVYGIDIQTQKVVKTFTLLGGETMSHPTGLAVHGDILFVGEQSMNVILTFNIVTERFIRQIIGPLQNDGVESLLLSDC
jgi:DNA-binding beta-propeller fold protein YncE